MDTHQSNRNRLLIEKALVDIDVEFAEADLEGGAWSEHLDGDIAALHARAKSIEDAIKVVDLRIRRAVQS